MVRARIIVLPAIALAGVALLSGCQGGVLDPQGPVGRAERTILLNALGIMLAVAVPTILATLGFAWWFREGNSAARYRPEFTYSGRVELLVWSIPTLVILFLGGIIWIGSHQLDPAAPLASERKALDVEVVSLDWKWLFIHPEQGVASVNELVVPVDTPLRLSLTSGSVMNAFVVPQLGSMIYTMNGMTTRLNLQADARGEYEGMSAMLSGDGFADMRFKVRVVSADAYGAWAARAKAEGAPLDARGYQALARQGTVRSPVTYRDVEASLFHDIATQKLPAAAGPGGGRGGADVSPRPGG